MAALARTIQDIGAQGGIVVSCLDLHSGAKKIAASSNVEHVILHPDSTTSDYVMRFLNQIFLGCGDGVGLSEGLQIDIIQDGKVLGERKG